jgi:hypothetical protein
MKMRLEAAIVMALLLASPVLGAPALQQMGHTDATEVIIYTDSSEAVVRQDSTVRLAEGHNTVSFEWATDSLDAASIRLHGGPALAVGEVVRPASSDRLMRWAVTAPSTDNYTLTTSFLLSGLKWSADYRLAWAPDGDSALLGGWLSVKNETGMDLRDLQVKLVLGRPGARAAQQATFDIPDLQELEKGASLRAGYLPPIEVPIRTIHRIDSEAAPERVKRLLEITPPTEGPLARAALPAGPMVLVTPTDVPPAPMQSAKLTYEPSEAFSIDLGSERDIVVERRVMERKKIGVEFDRLGKVSGFDTVESYEVALRSHLGEAIEVELVETVLETWELKTDAQHVIKNGRAVMAVDLPPEGEAAVVFTLVKHSGTRIP